MNSETVHPPTPPKRPRKGLNYFTSTLWAGGGLAAAGLILISCGTGHNVALLAPPAIPGAEFVGSEECATCHEEITRDFITADHARLIAKGPNSPDMGCEGCHGPGSKHVEAGGGAGTIINLGKNPEGCFNCHLDVKASFNLPYSHPVLSGKVSCTDCHDPHKGSAIKGGGTQLAGANETCFQCHSEQRGPFVFEHLAVREGCSSCHSPHGSTNQKLLTERNATLCLKCHMQDQSFSPTATRLRIGTSAHATLGSRLSEGTCWTMGCHEGVHGSNVDRHLRE